MRIHVATVNLVVTFIYFTFWSIQAFFNGQISLQPRYSMVISMFEYFWLAVIMGVYSGSTRIFYKKGLVIIVSPTLCFNLKP